MPPKPFALSSRILADHGFSGRTLALAPEALGSMVQLLAERPADSERWALQGRRADSMVWAPLLARQVAAAASNAPMRGPDDDDEGEESSSSSLMGSGPVVRVVKVRGPLSSEVTDWGCGFSDGYQGRGGIVERARQAHADPNCVAVVFDGMSPGGDASLCGESAAELAAMREASGKPVLAFTGEATSAMYYLLAGAVGAGGIFASSSADLGCIGTRTWHVDKSKANADEGLVVTHIGDPPGKILGNPDEPLAPEARARIQRDISESTARFVADVAAYRPQLTPDALRKLDADTRRGQAAVDEGLADGLAGSLGEVVALAYARAQALAAPTVITSSAGGPPALEEDMPLSAAALSALGLKPGASAAAIETAILAGGRPVSVVLATTEGAHDPLRALGAVALDALGGGDAETALVELPRMLARGRVAPEQAAENDALRREKAWNAAIPSTFSAGEVWRQVEVDGPLDAKGQPTKVRGKAYSPMATAMNAAYADVAALEARLAKLPKLGRASANAEQAADPAAAAAVEQARGVAGSMSAATAQLARKQGLDPVRLAQMTESLFAENGT